MPKGRLLKSKIREAKAVAKATEEGKLKALKKEPLQQKFERIGMTLAENPSQVVEAALYAGLAYLSYEKMGKHWESAFFGPVALKLATSPNEIAAASGVIGLGILGVLTGISGLPPEVVKGITDTADKIATTVENKVQDVVGVALGSSMTAEQVSKAREVIGNTLPEAIDKAVGGEKFADYKAIQRGLFRGIR